MISSAGPCDRGNLRRHRQKTAGGRVSGNICGRWGEIDAFLSFVLHPGVADVAGHEMADRHDLVSCGTHGARPAAFVCRHVPDSLRTRARVGFHTPGDDADDDQAWCDACERVRDREGE
jgi:hypothetical protein